MKDACKEAIVALYYALTPEERKTKGIPYYKECVKQQFPALLTSEHQMWWKNTIKNLKNDRSGKRTIRKLGRLARQYAPGQVPSSSEDDETEVAKTPAGLRHVEEEEKTRKRDEKKRTKEKIRQERAVVGNMTDLTLLDSHQQEVLFAMVQECDMAPAVQTFLEARELQQAGEEIEGQEADFDTDGEQVEFAKRRQRVDIDITLPLQLQRERELTKTLMQKNLEHEETIARLQKTICALASLQQVPMGKAAVRGDPILAQLTKEDAIEVARARAVCMEKQQQPSTGVAPTAPSSSVFSMSRFSDWQS